MFITAAGTPIAYTDPGAPALRTASQRWSPATAALRISMRRRTPIHFAIRVFNMVQALAARPDLRLSAAWFTREDLDRTSDFVDRADLLIICRTRYDQQDRPPGRACKGTRPDLCFTTSTISSSTSAHGHTIGGRQSGGPNV